VTGFVTADHCHRDALEMIHIATAANENYAPGLLVTVASMLVSMDPEAEVTLHFLNGGVSASTMADLRRLSSSLHRQCTLVDIPLDESLFAGANLGPGNSYMAYARLLMGTLIKASKVIYVDSDMVVLRDLSKLWTQNIEGVSALVCSDKKIKYISKDCPVELNDSEKYIPYFNTGLLVMDLNFWRSAELEKKSLYMAKNYKCELWDQTILNYVLKKNVVFLEQEWNWPFSNVTRDGKVQKWNYHFSDRQKPWTYFGSNIKHKVWRYYHKRYIGNTSRIFLSKKGLIALLSGIKEVLIRRFSFFRKAFFFIHKTRNENKDISGLIDFYWNDSLKISPWREGKMYRSFITSIELK
jgi:lipopolysaccharide biosynthesis glycosyltransferase